jgi:hypothetical protein
MSDFLKKCEEIEAKLKGISEEQKEMTPLKKVARPMVVVNHLTNAQTEDDRKAQALANRLYGMMGGTSKRQPTDQELFGHLVPTEEQIKKAEDEWGNGLNNFFREVQKPIHKSATNDFGRRGPIREEDLTEEEQRIRQIPVDPRMLKDE